MKIPIRLNLRINPKTLKFIALFAILISIFYLLSVLFESFIPLFNMHSTAQALWFILDSVGVHSTLEGTVLSFDAVSIQIVRQCTGVFEVMALAAIMLAYPASKWNKLAGIVFAVPAIYMINIARLIVLSLLAISNQPLFDAVHEYFFQITFIFLVIFFWLFWIRKVVKSDKDKE